MFLDSKGERKVIKNKIIKVQDILITVASEDFDDYICITDMAVPRKVEIQERGCYKKLVEE